MLLDFLEKSVEISLPGICLTQNYFYWKNHNGVENSFYPVSGL